MSPKLQSSSSSSKPKIEVTAEWSLTLNDGKHEIQFEHGTTSGKRVIVLDGKEIHRKNWMFKLVGHESFYINKKTKAKILIEAVSGFSYEYTLEVNGKPLQKFTKDYSKTCRIWCVEAQGREFRICMELDTLDVFVNGEMQHVEPQFSEEFDGSERHFMLTSNMSAHIKSFSSGNKREGIVHELYVGESGPFEPDLSEKTVCIV
ncbi:fas apoptotic inhibitory molecule 1-like [Symsagittifera roscoffensis]|uniref:fas apoptotic inhibitory molecule 1-like n=1 Tax=Symsagittifera roscoffensis TaxID=84072 RepID=UPI00307C06DC